MPLSQNFLHRLLEPGLPFRTTLGVALSLLPMTLATMSFQLTDSHFPHIPCAQLLSKAQALHQGGQLPQAEATYRELLQQEPGHGSALHGLGLLLAAQARFADALEALKGAASALPSSAAVQVDIGQVLRGARRLAEASPYFERAVALEPANRAYQLFELLHRATLLDQQGRPEEAMACFVRATEEHPESADAWGALGFIQSYLMTPVAATASLQRALQLDPTRTDVIERFGRVLQEQGRYEDSALTFERLLKMEPMRPLVAGRLMHSKMLTADWTSLEVLQTHVEAHLAAGELCSEPFGLQGFCESPALLGLAARGYTAKYAPDASSVLGPAAVGSGERIRLGYLSGEFRDQATSVLLTEVLERHDRERFEIVAFDNGWGDGSDKRRRIEACVKIEPIRRIAAADVARRVRALGIDILINLNGFFGEARTDVFSLRPAPIQVNYLGFPGTIGATYIDYIIADQTVIPEEDQAHYAEKVVYLPDCYQPNDATRPVGAWPARRADIKLPDDRFVFCCMNNVYKIVPAMYDVWMRILTRVPNSVLLLYSKVPEAHLNLRAEAQARGVEPQRILFGPPLSGEKHLARLRLTDLFLDTLPYNAHTTGSDALWAGLPILTCLGRAFPGRVCASLLRAVGLPELVTSSLAEYEDLAVRLANEPGVLAALRARLAGQLRHAPLYDTPRYTRHLEAAYSQMVQRARAGLEPTGFTCIAES